MSQRMSQNENWSVLAIVKITGNKVQNFGLLMTPNTFFIMNLKLRTAQIYLQLKSLFRSPEKSPKIGGNAWKIRSHWGKDHFCKCNWGPKISHLSIKWQDNISCTSKNKKKNISETWIFYAYISELQSVTWCNVKEFCATQKCIRQRLWFSKLSSLFLFSNFYTVFLFKQKRNTNNR